jgi:hypothetical protein
MKLQQKLQPMNIKQLKSFAYSEKRRGTLKVSVGNWKENKEKSKKIINYNHDDCGGSHLFWADQEKRNTKTKHSWHHIWQVTNDFSLSYMKLRIQYSLQMTSIIVKGISSGKLVCIMLTSDNLRITVNDVTYVPSLQGELLDLTWIQSNLWEWGMYSQQRKWDGLVNQEG